MIVVDIENVKIPSLNNKYGVARGTGRLFLTKEYRGFKQLIEDSCVVTDIEPPYYVYILVRTYSDIDNIIKATLDGIQGKAITDDRYIHRLVIEKVPEKRGRPGSIQVQVEAL